jgi:chemosensory pili system protein ChpC
MSDMNQAPIDDKIPDNIPSMLLSVEDKLLLLPSLAVAEIIHFPSITKLDDTPDWYLGNFEWRTLEIPLVSFELLNQQSIRMRHRHVVVLNNTGVDKKLPFIAIPLLGIPRLVRITNRDLEEDTETVLAPMELTAAQYAGELIIVPNVTAMERACLEVYATSIEH